MPDTATPLTADQLRTAIFDADDIAVEPVSVPEWGGITLYVKTLSGSERERYLASIRRTIGAGRKDQHVEIVLEDSSAKLVAMAACDAEGTALFKQADIAALGKKSAKALRRVVDAAAKLNGLNDDAESEAKNDSGATESGSSSTDSPSR